MKYFILEPAKVTLIERLSCNCNPALEKQSDYNTRLAPYNRKLVDRRLDFFSFYSSIFRKFSLKSM